jgi:hypothetical protein
MMRRYRWQNRPGRFKNSDPVKTLALLCLAFFLAVPFVSAQENYGTIHVITKVLPDGSKVTTKMDPDSHTAEEMTTDASDKLLRKTVYELGDNNVAVSATFYDAKNNPTYKAIYKRDGVGHITEAAFNTLDGRYLGKRVFVYAGGDKATQIIDYDANGQQVAASQPATPKGTSKKRH